MVQKVAETIENDTKKRFKQVDSCVFARYSRPLRKVGSDLHTAAVDGDVELVKALLKPNQNGQVLDVNAAAKDGQRMTPLMLASRYGNLQVMEELLVQGAKVNLRTPKDDTALHFAASSRNQIEACKLLVRHGGGPRALRVGSRRSSSFTSSGSIIDIINYIITVYTYRCEVWYLSYR